MGRRSFDREPMWRRYLRFWGPAPDADIDDELAFHVQARADELIGQGWSPEAARREAERALGPTREVRQQCSAISQGRLRRRRRREYLAGWTRDVAYALRVLRRTRLATLSAVLILATATGASTAIFTVLDATIFKPLPVANVDRLVRLELTPDEPGGRPIAQLPEDDLARLAAASRSLAALAGFGFMPATTGTPGAPPPQGSAVFVTGNFFDVLGLRPTIGRTLVPSDDDGAAEYHVAVASFRFWRDHLGRDPAALGGTAYVDSVPFTIVGVLPEGFEGLRKGANPDLYVPMAAHADLFPIGAGRMQPIGLLSDDVRLAAAGAELAASWDRLHGTQPPGPGTVGGRLAVVDLSRGLAAVSGDQEASLYLVGVVIGLTVLIGCVNVSCLLMARGAARRHEAALRVALGAGAWPIVRQSLVESGLLALAGGALGGVVAFWGEHLLLAGLQWGDRPIALAPDARVLAFSLALTIGAGLLCGALPARQALSARHGDLHRAGHAPPFRSGRVLIAVEVALSLVLVAAAVMFLRGFGNLRSIPLGFDARNVAVVRLFPDYDGFPDGVDRERYLTAEASRLRRVLDASPDVDRAAFTNGMAFSGGTDRHVVTRTDGSGAPRGLPVNVRSLHVDDGYFDVLRIPLVAGRPFSARDDDSSRRVVILSESLARQLFGRETPLGQPVRLDDATALVVGIVGDVRTRSVKEPAAPMVYLPFGQPPTGRGFAAETDVHVSTTRPAAAVAAAIDDELTRGRYALQVWSTASLDDQIGASYREDRIRMQATAIFGLLALGLIAAGVYGLMAYATAQRAREIGVRLAMGATPSRIVGLILKDGLRLVAIGLVVGIPGALASMHVLAAYVFDLSSADPASLVGAVGLMLIAAALATAGPAWRAARIDPVRTLRAE